MYIRIISGKMYTAALQIIRNNRFKLFMFFLITTISAQSYSQTSGTFVSYTVNDGLPQSSIQSITQDKDGFLWIATADGICRFDGYNFKVYKHRDSNLRSANSDWHNHFYHARDGALWMASYNGISRYNSNSDDFTNVLTYDTHTVVTTENKIYGEDDLYLWAGLSNWGLVKINKRTLKVGKVQIKGLIDPLEVHSWYRGFMEKGRIWIVTRKHFYIYTIATNVAQKIDIGLSGLMSVNDTLAIGFDKKNIILINKKTLATEYVAVLPDLADHKIGGGTLISPSEILFHSDPKGLFYFNIPSRKITKTVSSVGEGNLRKYLAPSCTYIDRSGNLWVGTDNDGLLKQNYPYRNFRLYRSPDPKSNQVFSIYADDKVVYAGCANNGVDIFARNGGFLKNVKVDAIGIPSLNTASVTVPVNDNQLLLLINSANTGESHTPAFYNTISQKLSTASTPIRSNHKQLWGQGNFRQFVFPYTAGVFLTNVGEYLLALKKDKHGHLSEEVVHRFKDQMLSCAFKDKEGHLWIGTYKGVFLKTQKGWQSIYLPKPVEVKCITEDENGNFWLATGIGIYLLDKNYRVTELLNEQNKLLNEHVYAMLKDKLGNIWFSHNKGISVYRWKVRKFQHYGERDGLQAAEFNSAAYFKASNGELFFGGINGTSSFFPDQLKDNLHTPKPLITAIGLFDKPYTAKGSAWTVRNLDFSYKENSLSFDFTMPEYSNPASNRFAYIMEGVDKTWINSGERRFARYPALKPGNYVFKVKAANAHGVWSKEAASIQVNIVPPFWQQTWFSILAVLLTLLLVVALVRFIERQRYQKKMRAMEIKHRIQSERERISRDLHDNIGTQLSLINKSIKEVTQSSNIMHEELQQHLDLAQQGAVEVIDTLRETIWALNKPEITLEEFSDNLKRFVQKQLLFHNNTALKISEPEAELDRLTILNPTEALNLFRIAQEAISNALKYAQATKIEVLLQAPNGKTCILIADNGTGFDAQQVNRNFHYGLDNMKFRAAEINYELEIESKFGTGTRITLRKNN